MSDWVVLEAELGEWAAREMTLPIWWRDDDAVADTRALERLNGLSRELGIALHLAVIPSCLEGSLAGVIMSDTRCLVHGWRHENHALKGKKAEFGSDRSLAARSDELLRGWEIIGDAFAQQARAVFVPPWNRMGEDLPPVLAEAGFVGLSTYTPRKAAMVAGVLQVNTHVDPIDWRGTRSAVEAEHLAHQTAEILKARRAGQADATEPLGFLTHHLVHDERIWDVTRAFWERLLAGPVQAVCPWG